MHMEANFPQYLEKVSRRSAVARAQSMSASLVV